MDPVPPRVPPPGSDKPLVDASGAGDAAASEDRFTYAIIIVKPFRVEPVLQALEPFRLGLLATTEVRGYGRQKGHLELYKGREYAISFIPKVKIEIVVPAGDIDGMIQAVSRAARTGRIGDGKVFLQGGEWMDLDLS